jgi:hypothetical protein
MIGVEVEGTLSRMSVSGFSLPPVSPVMLTTVMPILRACSAAARMLGELPLVEMASSTAPADPCASTWRENTVSKP